MRPFMHLVYLLAVPRLFSTTNAIPAPVTPANFEGPLPQRVPQPEPARVVRGRAAAATTPVGIPDCPPPGFSCEKNCDCTGKTGSDFLNCVTNWMCERYCSKKPTVTTRAPLPVKTAVA